MERFCFSECDIPTSLSSDWDSSSLEVCRRFRFFSRLFGLWGRVFGGHSFATFFERGLTAAPLSVGCFSCVDFRISADMLDGG